MNHLNFNSDCDNDFDFSVNPIDNNNNNKSRITIRVESRGKNKNNTYIEGDFPEGFDFNKMKKVLSKMFNVSCSIKKDEDDKNYFHLSGSLKDEIVKFFKDEGII